MHKDNQLFEKIIQDLSEDPRCQKMKSFTQHGTTTTFDHCMLVAKTSFALSRLFHLHVNDRSLIRGAFLHDYYLYDWHNSGVHLHGFRHPQIAVQNAVRDFHLSPLEAEIVRTHMWPLTLRAIPRHKESFLVCLADKLCALKETLKR